MGRGAARRVTVAGKAKKKGTLGGSIRFGDTASASVGRFHLLGGTHRSG